jgi:hypothetical protein
MPYEAKVIAIINKIGDLADAAGFYLPADEHRQPTLDEVEHLLDLLIDQAEQATGAGEYAPDGSGL